MGRGFPDDLLGGVNADPPETRMEPPVVDEPLFFLDYDGTLAPIVDEPAEAYPHQAIPAILDELARRHPLYIVTGRNLDDVEKLLGKPYQAIGLHGVQLGTLQGSKRSAISDRARAAIDRFRISAPQGEGLQIEEKGPLFAVHYRQASDKEAARFAIRQWLADVPGVLDPIWGKDVVELRPSDVSKGTAVREIADLHPDRTPLYIGDDVTDEDAFRALDDDAVTIKVGEGETGARYRLAGVEDVATYLKRYVASSE